MSNIASWAALLFGILATLGCLAMLAAGLATRRFARGVLGPAPDPVPVPVTILKPLYGAEPRLTENLATFRDQLWSAPIQIAAGVARSDDGAIPAARSIGDMLDLAIDARRYGANAKVSNLINIMPIAQHDILILSDSDIAAPPDYLRRIVATLNQPGVGVVTCPYAGRGDTGFWSRMAAAMVSYQFLPSVLLGVSLGAGGACMGSTIALRRETLDAIGGFDRFADTLADDHAIGAAVRAIGLTVAVAPVVVAHAHEDADLGAMARHELRWMATVRDLAYGGHVGSILLHALPLALLAFVAAPGPIGVGLVAAAIAARLFVAHQVDRMIGRRTMAWWLLPFRDLLSFALHIASLGVRTVDWRGETLTIREAGRIEARHP